jgi:hypothetical protein
VLLDLVPKCRPPQCLKPYAALHVPEIGKLQDQVKVLIEKTASSLDAALKMLFVSVQKNNIELCIRHAINLYVPILLMRFDYHTRPFSA